MTSPVGPIPRRSRADRTRRGLLTVGLPTYGLLTYGLLTYGLLTFGLLTLGACGSGGFALPPGTVGSAGDELPRWTAGGVDPRCPPGFQCVVGRAEGRLTLAEAQAAARQDALVQLAELAFPTDVATDYRASRVNDRTDVRSTVRARLVGRLRAARSLDDFWLQQRRVDDSGLVTVHSAWALLAVQRDRLARFHAEEVRRAARVGPELLKRLTGLAAKLVEPDTVAPAAASLAEVARAVARLQPGKEQRALDERLRELKAGLAGRLAIEQVGWEPDLERGRGALRLRVSIDGAVVPNLPLRSTGSCAGAATTTTDAGGEVVLVLTPGHRRAPCQLVVALSDAPTIQRTFSTEPLLACADFDLRLGASGPLGAALEAEAAALHVRLASVAEATVPACRDRSHRLRLDVSVRLTPVRRARSGVLVAGGTLRASLSLAVGERTVVERRLEPALVKGVGRHIQQIRPGLLREVIAESEVALRAGLQGL